MPGVPQWAEDALSEVYDPCCREKGISVVDMGLVRSVRQAGDRDAYLAEHWAGRGDQHDR